MKIYFTVKSIGKRKPFLSKQEYMLTCSPSTLKDLITEIVEYHVRRYNERSEQSRLTSFLTEEEIGVRGSEGKVGFGSRYDEREAVAKEAVQTALQAFEDGLYRIFLREEEVTKLDDRIDIQVGDDVSFIRFTMLAGRLW